MKEIYYLIEWVFGAALFINALLFIPQIIVLLKKKSSADVSLITFLGFFLIQSTVVLHGLTHKDHLLVSGYLLSMFVCGVVVFLILLYRKNGPDKKIDFETIIEQLPGHIYCKDTKGAMLYCNKRNLEAFKFPEDYRGKTDYDLFPQEVADMLWKTDEAVMRTEELRIVEEEDKDAEGGPRVYLSHKVPLRDKHSTVIGMAGVSVDITEARRINKEHLEILENIIALMPGHVYWVNREGIYMGCNDNQAKSAGLRSRKDIVGKRNKDLPWNFHATGLPETLDKINKEVMETGRELTLEERALPNNGVAQTYLSSKVPVRNRQEVVIGMVGISIDISHIKKTEQELMVAKKMAESANAVKTEFLYNMQHDLRTPFSGILGMAEFMENTEENAEKKENLGCVTQSAKVLLDHLNQILAVLHLEGTQTQVLEKQFHLSSAIEELETMMLPAAKNKHLSFELQKAHDLPEYIIGDKAKMQRVLINLIANAIKFTQEGHITLSVDAVKKDNETVIIKFIVEDTGVGIPKDKYDLVFEQFNRITSSYSGIYSGQGLGLRLVKRFLDEMGGEVHLDSQLGKGSVFKVLIPFKLTLLNCPEEAL